MVSIVLDVVWSTQSVTSDQIIKSNTANAVISTIGLPWAAPVFYYSCCYGIGAPPTGFRQTAVVNKRKVIVPGPINETRKVNTTKQENQCFNYLKVQ